MSTELDRGLRCVEALAELQQYIKEKDISGECQLRVRAPLFTPFSLITFIFEFPPEYGEMCQNVYFTEAKHIMADLEDVEVSLMPPIEAINRYNSVDVDATKCGFMITMPEKMWLEASGSVIGEFARGIVGFVVADTFNTLLEFINTVQAAYDSMCSIHRCEEE